jgi:hypothetical protein
MSILNCPENWTHFENSVRLAVLDHNDEQLKDLIKKLQHRWNIDRKPSQFETLQALYKEQHRRAHS